MSFNSNYSLLKWQYVRSCEMKRTKYNLQDLKKKKSTRLEEEKNLFGGFGSQKLYLLQTSTQNIQQDLKEKLELSHHVA